MDYSCNKTAYFKEAEADLTIKALRRMLHAGQGDLPPSLTVVDDYTVHKLDSFNAGLQSINSTRILVKPGLTSLHNPGDRLINKIIKAKTKSKYIAWSMRQTPDEHGKLPVPYAHSPPRGQPRRASRSPAERLSAPSSLAA